MVGINLTACIGAPLCCGQCSQRFRHCVLHQGGRQQAYQCGRATVIGVEVRCHILSRGAGLLNQVDGFQYVFAPVFDASHLEVADVQRHARFLGDFNNLGHTWHKVVPLAADVGGQHTAIGGRRADE